METAMRNCSKTRWRCTCFPPKRRSTFGISRMVAKHYIVVGALLFNSLAVRSGLRHRPVDTYLSRSRSRMPTRSGGPFLAYMFSEASHWRHTILGSRTPQPNAPFCWPPERHRLCARPSWSTPHLVNLRATDLVASSRR
ncbi:hypothetical protein SCLCIDRAFT_905864 [Scleroderma citrinum Foug A]|uniref:Uncharacterized protein n=1 Tax=Scleroderma citrinum Foug A TaxID=1036808 RepID=A0A0C3EL38_9AGAM|nr:hypothetical protein SCLCIDRAFT_905864 [Scleroderma citrinum Foug A]